MSRILGAVPHPTGFRLRAVEDERGAYAFGLGSWLFLVAWALAEMPQPDGSAYPDLDANPGWVRYLRLDGGLDAAVSLTGEGGQLPLLEAFATEVRLLGSVPLQQDYLAPVADVADRLVDLLQAHEDRTSPLGFVSLWRPEVSRMIADDEPRAFFAMHAETEAEWQEPLVAPGRADGDLAALRAWLRALADDAAAGPRTYDHTQALPLLQQLLRWSVRAVGRPRRRRAARRGARYPHRPRRGHRTAQAPGLAAPPDAISALRRLTRETLGAWSYRLDAWYTALAAWRLENHRATAPRGLQVGAFGMLVNVRPRDAAASGGFVLAPSLAHATTAAVLRSGWQAFGGAGQAGALAVDLSSARVRRARWIVEGVRRGQDLAELLGARFERGLHDAGQAARVDDFRTIALRAVGDGGPPNAIVDGLLLARAWSGADDLTRQETAARAAVDAALPPSGAERAALVEVLDAVAADLDSVGDLAVAQTVHALAQGNPAEATAALTASSTGEVTFPAPRVADTARSAVTVTHRLLSMLDPTGVSPWPGGAASGRAAADPGLEAWVGDLLGPPSGVRFEVQFLDPAAGAALGAPVVGTAEDLGVGALDLVQLAPGGEDAGRGGIGMLVAAWAAARPDAPAGAVPEVRGAGRGHLTRRHGAGGPRAARPARRVPRPHGGRPGRAGSRRAAAGGGGRRRPLGAGGGRPGPARRRPRPAGGRCRRRRTGAARRDARTDRLHPDRAAPARGRRGGARGGSGVAGASGGAAGRGRRPCPLGRRGVGRPGQRGTGSEPA